MLSETGVLDVPRQHDLNQRHNIRLGGTEAASLPAYAACRCTSSFWEKEIDEMREVSPHQSLQPDASASQRRACLSLLFQSIWQSAH